MGYEPNNVFQPSQEPMNFLFYTRGWHLQDCLHFIRINLYVFLTDFETQQFAWLYAEGALSRIQLKLVFS